MIDANNMTHAEHFSLNGSLSIDRQESLLDAHSALQSHDVQWQETLQEALGCFPSKDFLCGTIETLQTLAKSLHGENRQKLFDAIAIMQDAINEQTQSAEYGAGELVKILRACK